MTTNDSLVTSVSEFFQKMTAVCEDVGSAKAGGLQIVVSFGEQVTSYIWTALNQKGTALYQRFQIPSLDFIVKMVLIFVLHSTEYHKSQNLQFSLHIQAT